MFFLLHRHTDGGSFDNYRYSKISDHFLKISHDNLQNLSEVTKHFLQISEDFQRLLKTFKEDLKMFQSSTNKFKDNLSEIIDIFTSEEFYGKYATQSPRCSFV